MPATSKYHITLNGEGYTLLEESRRRQVQTPYVARFATGDPSVGDLSFWQHVYQDQFNGGVGQEKFLVKNRTFRTLGMVSDPLRKELFMSRHPVNVTSLTIQGNAATYGYINRAKAVGMDGITVVAVPTADWAASFTSLGGTSDHVANQFEQYTVPSLCAEFFSRDSSATAGKKGVVVGLHNSVSFRELPTLAETAAYTLPGSLSANGSVTAICQCTIDVFAFGYLRPDAADGNQLILVKFQDNSFSSIVWSLNINTGHNIPVRALIDAAGHLWVLSVERAQATFSATATNLFVDPGVGTSKSKCSFLYRYNAGSLDTDPYADIIIPLPGYVFKDMELLGDSLYLFGERIGDPKSSVSNILIPVVYKVGFGEVFRGYNTTASMQMSYTFNTGDKILFSIKEDNIIDTSLQPINIYSLHPGDIINCEAQYDSDNASGVYPIGVWIHANNLYLVTNDTEASSTEGVYRFDSSTNFASDGLLGNKYFISSIYTADSPLIDKYIAEITVKLTGAINTTNQEVQVYLYEDESTLTSLGSFTNGNTIQAFSTAAGTSARVFRAVIRSASLVDAQQMGIESVDVRFVPVPLKKYQWSFAVRLDNKQKLLNGDYENESPQTKMDELESAYENNASITFVDIDGTSYTVMITDMIERTPLINEVSIKQEYIVFLELLQV